MKKYGVASAIAALVCVCGAASAQVYTSTPGLAINDNTTISDNISVAGGPTAITGITVSLNINHTYDGDLDIALVHNGQFIILTTDNGGTGENFQDTLFDDGAAASITTGVAPFLGSYKPEGGFVGWNGVPTPPEAVQNDTFAAWMNQDGNGTWTLIVADDAGIDVGTLNSWTLTLTGTSGGPTNPFGFGSAAATTEVGTSLMTVTVTGGQNPPSTGLAVRADLSGIGGSATQQFYNDGTHGDVAAGDNIFSNAYSLPVSVMTGNYTLPVTVSDAQSRSTTSNMGLVVSNGPNGACCNGGCSITRQTLCAQAGGTYQGAGTNCGVGYTFSASDTPFEDISATGTLLATVSSCDDCTENVGLPFTFTHLGNAYTSVDVSSNGNLQFSNPSTAYVNAAIPNTGVPNDMLAPLWDDLYPVGAGDIYFLDDSTANHRVVISWQGVAAFANTTPDNTFQVILYENGNAEFRYGTILPEAPAGDYTIGYENIDGTDGGSIDASTLGGGNTGLTLTATNTNPCGPQCDSIDFNGDTLFPDTQDITDFIAVFGGSPCPTGTCGDIDFNNDGLFPDTDDIGALIRVFGGGSCMP
ncbi:MAG: proprotein convertase P-domain-containing protein [Phycisphaerales bacterium]